jgi:signal transduction histidine kinase
VRIANRAGAALLASALIVLVFVAIVFWRDTIDSANREDAARQFHASVDTAQEILTALVNAETGQRGFLLTGRESYLKPYNAGLDEYKIAMANLLKLTSDSPGVESLVPQIEANSKGKLREMAFTITLKRANDVQGVLRRIQQDIGMNYMDQIRRDLERLIRIEERAYQHNAKAVKEARENTRNEILVAAVLLFLLTFAGAALLSVEIRYERGLAANLEVSEKKYRDLAENLEEQVENRTRELEQVNKELSAFAYSVSHDLRAPLRAIDGFSQIVLEDYSDRLDSTGQDMLNRIRSGARRMGQLIQSLLELSRVTRQDLRSERVSLTSMAESIVEELSQGSPSRKVEVTIAPDLEVHADPQLMRVVMDNLIGNAWKFTSKTEAGRIEVGKTNANGSSAYYVRDNGSGFDSTYAGRLFTPFQRLHSESEFEGTGIGLATVQRVINRHGGKIWAESTRGAGATFFFAL